DKRVQMLDDKIKIFTYSDPESEIERFIELLAELELRNFDLVCNIDADHPIDLSTDERRIWSDLCLAPILGSKQTVNEILYCFAQDLSVGMIGSADVYKSFKQLGACNQKVAIIRT